MSKINIDLLRKDECEPLTTEQMNDIKSQFHPSNTANVNIVPYEIYDEDGEEIVVGEIRKTIDGVKKKKPLYTKILQGTWTWPSTRAWQQIAHNIENVDRIKVIEAVVLDSSGTYYPLAYMDGNTYGTITIDKNRMNFCGNGYGADVNYEVVVEYTKTSDEWQPV